MASLYPWFTTNSLSYRFPIFETSATALCGTTGIFISRYVQQLIEGLRNDTTIGDNRDQDHTGLHDLHSCFVSSRDRGSHFLERDTYDSAFRRVFGAVAISGIGCLIMNLYPVSASKFEFWPIFTRFEDLSELWAVLIRTYYRVFVRRCTRKAEVLGTRAGTTLGRRVPVGINSDATATEDVVQ